MIEQWNETYFSGSLSADVIELLRDLEKQHPQVQATAEIMFRLMNKSRFYGRDFSPLLAWEYGFILSRIHPSAWGGMIPPITLQGRHARIDDYVAANPWSSFGSGSLFLDLGCGFPPLTTVDTGKRFPEWRILGADPSFGLYMVSDPSGDYACFETEQKLRYFQPGTRDPARWDRLHRNRAATIDHFTRLFNTLLPRLPSSAPDELSFVELEGAKLVKNPVRQFESSNLTFQQNGIGSVDVRDVAVVRCFNVLVYFDRAFRNRALEWLSDLMIPGGIFLCGLDWARNSLARYSVYRKEKNRLVPKEFAFSIDNLRPLEMISWLTYVEEDPEVNQLAELVGLIRSDAPYRESFDAALDQLLSDLSICERRPDGYLGGLEEMLPAELERRLQGVADELDEKGFVEGAIAVLKRGGWNAWRNNVGHIAVSPP